VIHPTARRLLPGLLDATLAPRTERAVRLHALGCRRCRRSLAELLEAEALLAMLPGSLVPMEPSAAADARLASLARWAAQPAPTLLERVVPMVGACAAAAALALVLSTPAWLPSVSTRSDPVTLAAVMPDSRLFPTGLR